MYSIARFALSKSSNKSKIVDRQSSIRYPILGFVLRRTFGHHAVRLSVKAVGRQPALEDDLGFVLEGIRHDSAVHRVDDDALALDLESVIEGVLLDEDRSGNDEAMQLQPLSFPGLSLR